LKHEDLLAEVKIRKDRCKRALDDPSITDLIKKRVLVPEYNILLLALEGYSALEQRKEKQDLLSTRPATIVGPQMD
jgi:hypothetical protein